jgi:DNA repair and recombination protein RAD54B
MITILALTIHRKKEVVKIKAPEGSIMLNEGHPEKDGGKEVHDVFVEPFLARSLREHQVEGVRFMYECIMGYRSFQGKGCLLADEMGLGKTLQSIALMWTLFSRGPQGAPVLKKAIIVTNSSLVNNWKNEIKKWLGNERIKPLVCQAKTGKKTPADTIKEFKTGYNKVMIISYDLCVRNADELKACRCDLLICDEGHKLKNSNIKIFQALKNVQTARRIALSGTPMQNDLGEFFSIVDFINPGLLGTDKSFKSLFTDPIDKSREPDAKAEHKRIGLARSQELNKLVSEFVLRRTSEILTKHLPPKYEMLVFCKMNPLQEQLYKYFVKSKYVYQLFANSEQKSAMGRHALSCIQNLKKLLTHPDMIYNVLVRDEEDDDEDDAEYDKRERFKETWQDSLSVFPKNYGSNTLDPTQSGKMELLDDLLRETHSKGDRIVVVSNFTSILNQIERLCGLRQYTFVRLDGSTPSDKRMQIVDEYNNGKSKDFVFLLSSRAGGAGLNLIGANRLVLFDPDWNPSNDHQAMARVWRDGQKKNVFIYRFISTGTIEEKIYQRQMVKTGLSKSVVDEKSMNKAAFSKEELRSLFGYNEDTICDTFSDEAEGADLEAIVKPVDAVLLKAIKGKKSVTFVKISKSEEEDALIAKNAITAPDEVEAAEESTENETSDEDTVMDVIDKEADEEEFNFDNKSDDESSEASDEEADEDEPPKKKQKIEYSSEESDD